jgi:amidase
MARSADDAALLLEAMMGDDAGLTPISVTPPWTSVAAAVAQSRDLKNLRIGYVPDIAGLGIDPEIGAACRTAAMRLDDYGANVEELEFSVADGLEAFLVLRGLTMAVRFFDSLHELEKFGPNLKGNIESGSRLTIGDIARAERKRAELWHRWRALFERVDLLLTPTTPVPPFPVEQNYPDTIAGRKMSSYIDCDFFSDAEQPSGRLGAVWADRRRASDRASDHRAALCRAENPCRCKACARGQSDRAADRICESVRAGKAQSG